MATSGSIDFIVTRDDIITEALELLGVLGEGETPTSDQLISCSRTLNMMTKTWQADGLNLFAVQTQYLFPTKGQREFLLNSNTTDNFTGAYNPTTVATAALAGDSSIEVSDATPISDGDFIGIASGTDVQWTLVSGPVSGSTVNLADTLVNDTAADNVVYTYTQKASRPMKIMEGLVRLGQSQTDIPLGNISRRQYNTLSVKSSSGIVNQFYYDPQITSGVLSLWPETNDESNIVVLFVQRTLDDLDIGTDNLDYPQEWYMPLAYNLAMHLSPKYGVPSQDYSIVERQAVMLYDKASGFDEELYTSVYFGVDSRGQDM